MLVNAHIILKHDFTPDSLNIAVQTIQSVLETNVILIEGCIGTGKSTLIEALVKEQRNIFISSSSEPYTGTFDLTSSDSTYIALDETEYFTTGQVAAFIKKAQVEDKVALLSCQMIEKIPLELQETLSNMCEFSVATVKVEKKHSA